VINEIWTSKALGITLKIINGDPRRGHITFEVEDLNTGEPDPALFTAPAGYKIEEIHPQVEMH
jgi:hypothetical protein